MYTRRRELIDKSMNLKQNNLLCRKKTKKTVKRRRILNRLSFFSDCRLLSACLSPSFPPPPNSLIRFFFPGFEAVLSPCPDYLFVCSTKGLSFFFYLLRCFNKFLLLLSGHSVSELEEQKKKANILLRRRLRLSLSISHNRSLVAQISSGATSKKMFSGKIDENPRHRKNSVEGTSSSLFFYFPSHSSPESKRIYLMATKKKIERDSNTVED